MIEKVRQERRKIASMSWLLASLLCLGLGSCQHDKATVADYGDKVLPPKDINSPVRTKEARHFMTYYDGLKDGKITHFDRYYTIETSTFNDEGYLTRRFTFTMFSEIIDSRKYEYDFSDKDFSYAYCEYMDDTEKMVYDKKGKLVKCYDGKTNRLLYEYKYKYNEKEQIVSEIKYNEKGVWVERNDTIYDGNITKCATTCNENGKEAKSDEYIIKHDTNGKETEEIRYAYYDGEIDTAITKYENGGNKQTTYWKNGEKRVSIYNSRGDEIEQYDYLSDGLHKVLIRREYDQYGNPTLEYRTSTSPDGEVDYDVTTYDYIYSDGTKFSAREAFPELFIK